MLRRFRKSASRLTGVGPTCDWHNALKLGYDVQALAYPGWLSGGKLGGLVGDRLPEVVRPGEPIGTVSAAAAASTHERQRSVRAPKSR